jgi:hypothetical protein
MKRFLLLMAAVVALVAVAAFEVPAPAASVNGVGVSRQSLDADLSAIAGSTGYQCYIEAGLQLEDGAQSTTGLFPVTGVGTGPSTYNTAFVTYWLTQMLSDQLVAQVLATRHQKVSSVDLALGRATLSGQITGIFSELASQTGSSCGTSGAALLASLPATFRNQQILAQSERDVLLAHQAGYGLDRASLDRYYVQHRAEFDSDCISYVSFATQSDATDAKASVDAGTPITSTGTLTAAGCDSATRLPTSVTSLAVGKVSTPVAEGTATGKYVLLVVTSRQGTPFPAARTAVEQAVLNAGSTSANTLLEAASRTARVTADPRYGNVSPKTIALTLPRSPPASFVLDPSANLPVGLADEPRTNGSGGG